MKLIHLGENLLRKVSLRNLTLALIGECLLAYSYGALYSASLQSVTRYILLTCSFSLLLYLYTDFKDWKNKSKVHYLTLFYGASSVFQIFFLLGIVWPVLASWWFVVAGVLLIVPEVWDLVR